MRLDRRLAPEQPVAHRIQPGESEPPEIAPQPFPKPACLREVGVPRTRGAYPSKPRRDHPQRRLHLPCIEPPRCKLGVELKRTHRSERHVLHPHGARAQQREAIEVDRLI